MAFFFLLLALIVIPLCLEFGFYPFLPDTILNYRDCKDFLAVFFSGIIILISISTKNISRQRFYWPGIFIAYLSIHQFLNPPIVFQNSSDQLIADLWQFKPLFLCFMYYLLFLCVQEVGRGILKQIWILKVMMWVGFISAVYLVIQALGMDTFQRLSNVGDSLSTTSGKLTSFLTHPNYAGSFIALCLPFSFYYRQWFKAGIMILAVFLCQSSFATISMIGGIVFWSYFKTKKEFRPTFMLGFFLIFLLGLCWFSDKGFLEDNGRFFVWLRMWEDFLKRPIFGYGFGSFPILFPSTHQGIMFAQAHNEIFQIIYETGIIGGILFLRTVWEFFKEVIPVCDSSEILLALTSSFVIILLGSLGLFVFQIEPSRFFAVIIFSLIISICYQRRKIE